MNRATKIAVAGLTFWWILGGEAPNFSTSASPSAAGDLPVCVGDCNGDGAVKINELLTMVNLLLGHDDPTCIGADANGNGRIEVDDVLVAVTDALDGCIAAPTATATATPPATATATATASATASFTASLTPTASETPTITLTPTETPTQTATPTPTDTPTATDTPTSTETPTVTETPTITVTPTATNTLGPLGIRHFVLNKSQSTFEVRIPPGLRIPVGNFEGQTNGVTEPAFLDLEAGQPDAQGITKVNIVGASEYIYVNAKQSAGFVFCIKLHAPAPEAGILACNGGVDISIALNVDHHLGKIGVNGFTAAQCAALHGQVEVPYSTCGAGLVGQLCKADADCDTSAGAGDGACTTHFPSRCVAGKTGAVCQRNTDCTSGSVAGVCGTPHGGVCNGPLVPVIESGDTGPGALVIAPNPEPPYQINGISVELNFESDLPCGDEGPGMPSPFALTTGTMRSAVTDANDDPGHQLNFETTGENFSCQDWQSDSLGRFVLSAPALDQYVPLSHIFTDVATTFNFWSH